MRFISLLVVLMTLGCYRADRRHTPVDFYRLADSLTAARLIVLDTTDGFFEALRPLDMALQLAKPAQSLPDVRKAYRLALQKDVLTLSVKQAEKLHRAAQLSRDRVVAMHRSFWIKPDFVVIEGTFYGNNVWFTRENCIVLPLNALNEWPEEHIARIITHEMYHIWSRRHVDARAPLFKLLGFEPLNKPLVLPPALNNNLLTNPDAVDVQWFMTAQTPQGQTAALVPLLIGRDAVGSLSFMQAVSLRWHPVDTLTGKVAATGYDLSELPAAQAQLGSNTDYVIHPEELLADHFMMLVWGEAPANDPKSKQLMQQVRSSLLALAAGAQ
jgi:hypothetical protein